MLCLSVLELLTGFGSVTFVVYRLKSLSVLDSVLFVLLPLLREVDT